MIEGIQPKLLAMAGPRFAHYLGMDWERDRNRIIRLINEFRDLLHIDPNMPNIFSHKAFCITPSQWSIGCLNSCDCTGDKFTGFTLPLELENVLEAWIDDEPITDLHSKWWEGKVCRLTNNTPTHDRLIVRTGQVSATQRPMIKSSPLQFYSDGNDGAEIRLRIMDIDGDIIPYTVTIEAGGVVETEEHVYGIDSISSSRLDGNCVIIADDDGYEITRIDGRIAMPQYPIYKIKAPCRDSVLIQGDQRYMEICHDDEIVEIGSPAIIKAAAKFLRYDDEGTDVAEINISDRNLNRVKQLIRGALKRKTGNNTVDGNPMTGERYGIEPIQLHGN